MHIHKLIFSVCYSLEGNYFLEEMHVAIDQAYFTPNDVKAVFTVESNMSLKTMGCKMLYFDKNVDLDKLSLYSFLKLKSNFPSALITRYCVASWFEKMWVVEEVWGNPPVNKDDRINILTTEQKIEVLKEATSFIKLLPKGERDNVEEIKRLTQLLYDELLNIIL